MEVLNIRGWSEPEQADEDKNEPATAEVNEEYHLTDTLVALREEIKPVTCQSNGPVKAHLKTISKFGSLVGAIYSTLADLEEIQRL